MKTLDKKTSPHRVCALFQNHAYCFLFLSRRDAADTATTGYDEHFCVVWRDHGHHVGADDPPAAEAPEGTFGESRRAQDGRPRRHHLGHPRRRLESQGRADAYFESGRQRETHDGQIGHRHRPHQRSQLIFTTYLP